MCRDSYLGCQPWFWRVLSLSQKGQCIASITKIPSNMENLSSGDISSWKGWRLKIKRCRANADTQLKAIWCLLGQTMAVATCAGGRTNCNSILEDNLAAQVKELQNGHSLLSKHLASRMVFFGNNQMCKMSPSQQCFWKKLKQPVCLVIGMGYINPPW